MNIRVIFLIIASLGLTTLGLAEEEIVSKMMISIDDDSGEGGVHFALDSEMLGSNLDDMQVGENRSIVDENGRPILITREAEGYRLDVDGKSFDLPVLFGGHADTMWVGDSIDEDVSIHVMRGMGEPSVSGMATVSAMPAMEGVMIFSPKAIDPATQQAIKSLLESAGHSDEVRFVGADEGHGGVHAIKVIEKTVEVTH